MNDKFFELSQEKQRHIINADMEVFGRYDYKRAVTDEIAFKAGISKGLLFYYFKNKKSFYLYLFQYCSEIMKTMAMDDGFQHLSDFFELIAYVANKKIKLLKEYPYIMEFVMRAYYAQEDRISRDVQQDVQAELQDSFSLYFKNVDWSKFKEGVDPTYIYRMLVWMSDGYLHELQSIGKRFDIDKMMVEFNRWMCMFRPLIYKEEYL